MDGKPSFCSLFLLTLLLGNVWFEHAHCELFTSIAHMESLLGLEMELLQTLNSYITAERRRWELCMCSCYNTVCTSTSFALSNLTVSFARCSLNNHFLYTFTCRTRIPVHHMHTLTHHPSHTLELSTLPLTHILTHTPSHTHTHTYTLNTRQTHSPTQAQPDWGICWSCVGCTVFPGPITFLHTLV